MTAKDYVHIIDAIADTPRVKKATKMTILGRLESVFAKDNKNFNSELYWKYINNRIQIRRNDG